MEDRMNIGSGWYSRMMKAEYYCILPKNLLPFSFWLELRSLRFLNDASLNLPQNCKCTGIISSIPHKPSWCSPMRSFTASVSLNHGASSLSEGDHLSNDNIVSESASENDLPQKLGADELKSLLLDSERSRLLKKLSEANQYNRFLKRQLQVKDDALVSLKNELAVLELETQALVNLAEEVANSVVQPGSRKIKGKYIQSHLLSRLQAVHERLKAKMKDANSLQSKEVVLIWVGMAESVQVMGSFDGWSQGQEMSLEYSGHFSRFSATLKLRPGRYEVKFLVDGEWLLSPELATVGEGMLKNNLLIVE